MLATCVYGNEQMIAFAIFEYVGIYFILVLTTFKLAFVSTTVSPLKSMFLFPIPFLLCFYAFRCFYFLSSLPALLPGSSSIPPPPPPPPPPTILFNQYLSPCLSSPSSLRLCFYCLSIYRSIHLSIYLSVCLSIYVCLSLSLCLPAYLCVYISTCLCTYLKNQCLKIYIYIYIVSVYKYLFIFLCT